MKIILSVLFFYTILLNHNDQFQVIGSWTMCKSGDTNGIELNRNVCPEINIKLNGEGSIDKGYLNFKWEIKNKTIQFLFDSEEGKSFFGNTSQFKFENHHDDKFQYLKLIDKSGNWYLLVKSKES